MSTQANNHNAVESVAAHPSQIATTSTTETANASRREPSTSTPGAAELASQPLDGASADFEGTKQKVISALRFFQDWPKPPVNFVDILPIFRNPDTFKALLDWLVFEVEKQFPSTKPDVIIGLEARGFLIGPPLALRLGTSFVPVRKVGKMPGTCVAQDYMKEYGWDKLEMQEDSIAPGQKVLIVDDIIATGGTAEAAAKLVEKCGGSLLGYLFMIEIELPEHDENGKVKQDENGLVTVKKIGRETLEKRGPEPIIVLHTERD